MACFEARIDIGEFLQMVSAQRSAAASASPGGTTSLTKPSSRPSLALTWRAVRIMPMARFSPICRGSRCTPPASAARPTRGSGSANVAFSEAMMRSQASAISKPPPMATPLTAAMIGLLEAQPGGRPGNSALVPAAFSPGRLPFQIVAGAKRLVAGAGDDRHPLLGIGAEIIEHLVELEMRIGMQRGVHFRTRQRHDRDRALARHLGEFQVHVCSRGFFSVVRNVAAILACSRRRWPPNYARRLRVTSDIPLLDLAPGSHLNRRQQR